MTEMYTYKTGGSEQGGDVHYLDHHSFGIPLEQYHDEHHNHCNHHHNHVNHHHDHE